MEDAITSRGDAMDATETNSNIWIVFWDWLMRG